MTSELLKKQMCWRQSKLLPKLNTSHTQTGVEQLCSSLQHVIFYAACGKKGGKTTVLREQVNAVCSVIPTN